MTTVTVRTLTLSLALCLASVAITGCSKDPQEKYDDATKQLNDAQQKVQSQQKDVGEAQQDLKDAQSDLAKAKQKAAQATQDVDQTVNDKVLFRSLQKKLLDKNNFDNAAISVAVQNRVVTLTGTVPDEKTHQQALKVAQSQPGVANVVDSLQVKNADSQDNAAKQSGSNAAPADGPSDQSGADQNSGNAN